MNKDVVKTRLQTLFTTERGSVFEQADVAYKTWGTLNKQRNNVVVICHALTGHAAADEWFPGIFGSGRLCDPEEHFIICINVPGSSYGSLGPWSVNPGTGKPYRGDFPVISIRDMVRFQMLLLNQLQIKGIKTVIGGSMGGMQALEFSIMDERVQSTILIAMGIQHSPWAIGISEAQRAAIYADSKWNNGFYDLDNPPSEGLSAARMMAMITYRTPKNYSQKFARSLQPGKNNQFQVESYLNYQGEKLAARFDALSYVALTKAMDTHDIARGRGTAEEVLSAIKIPVQVIAISSDLLYPPGEQQELARHLPDAVYSEIESEYGHDAFLIEFEQLNKIINPFISKIGSNKENHVTTKNR
jgi:homoserine O-acetyltransferase